MGAGGTRPARSLDCGGEQDYAHPMSWHALAWVALPCVLGPLLFMVLAPREQDKWQRQMRERRRQMLEWRQMLERERLPENPERRQ